MKMNLVFVGIFEVAGFVAGGFVLAGFVAGFKSLGSCTFRPYWVGFWQGGFTDLSVIQVIHRRL